MRKNKLLFILIPLTVILLILGGGFVYLKLNSTPQKIFKTAINKTFNAIETRREKYNTVREKVELTANIESDDESLQEINNILDGSKVTVDLQADIKNLLLNENINAIYNNEKLIDANFLIQDKKVYILLKDWLNKYIEIPMEEESFTEIGEEFDKVQSVDVDKLLKVVEEELINEVTKQKLLQKTVVLNLDGKETRVTQSSLELNMQQAPTFLRELLQNLKQNNDFQIVLGEYREEFLNSMNEAIDELSNDYNLRNDGTLVLSIYTKGLLNEFIAIDFKVQEETISGMEFIKHSKEKFEFSVYEKYEEKKDYEFRAIINNKKEDNNKGTANILLNIDNEEYEIIYKYEKNNNQIIFEASTEIEGTKLTILGNTVKVGMVNSGKMIFTIEQPEYGRINLNILYSIENEVDISKVDTSNLTSVDNLTEEEQEELVNNMENSKFYEVLMNSTYGRVLSSTESAMEDMEEQDLFDDFMGGIDEKNVALGYNTVGYNVPDKLRLLSYNSRYSKTYTDDNNSIVNVYIARNESQDYLEKISESDILTSSSYVDQNISDISEYELNGKEFKYRGISYSNNINNYSRIFFVYELSGGYIYVVDATIVGNSLSLEDINYFLAITI